MEKVKSFLFLKGLLPINKKQFSSEIIAGLTLAALAIPEVMGYTKIAGTPVITGLYTMLIPMALFAFFGSSRHLVVGADSATAAILAAGMIGLSTVGTDEYVALASVLALIVAFFLIVARIIGLGFMADFLSKTVLVGFLSGVGIQVALGQVSGMLGLENGSHGPFGNLWADIQMFDQINYYALGLSLGVLLLIFVCKIISKKIPGALIAVISAIVLSWLMNFGQHMQVIGTIPSGLPHLSIPEVTWSLELFYKLVPTAFAMVIVILAQSAATSRAYASRYQEKFSANKDIIGLAIANIGAGISGTFVVNGSPTKTQMVDSAGGRTQLSQLFTVVIVIIVLLFLTEALAFMPEAVLSAVVFHIGIDLIDFKGMRKIFIEHRSEFWIALTTAIMVVGIGVEQGIIFAILLSLIDHTRRGYHPKNALFAKKSPNSLELMPLSSNVQVSPGLLIYRFSHSLYYANTELFSNEVNELVKNASFPINWFCIDVTALDDIDFTATQTLISIQNTFKEKGIRIVFLSIMHKNKSENDHKLEQIFGKDSHYESLHHVISDYEEKYGST